MVVQGFLKSLRWLIGWIPVTLVAFGGGSYLAACFSKLLAPSVPLVLRYPSPAGIMELHAGGYNLDPRSGAATITGISLRDPKGALVAASRVVFVKFDPGSVWNETSPISVALDHPYIKLVRNEIGHLDATDYLPPKKATPSLRPVAVVIEGGVADFVDHYRVSNWRLRVLASRADVDVLGDRWSATAPLNIGQVGALSLLAQGAPDYTVATIDSSQLQLRSLLEHLGATDLAHSLSGLTEGSTLAAGSVTVLARPSQPVDYHGWVVATSQALAYKSFLLPTDASCRLVFSRNGAYGLISLSRQGMKGTWHGRMRWRSGFGLSGVVQADIPAPDEVGSYFRGLMKGLAFRNGQYQGWLATTGPGTWTASGHLNASDLSWRGQNLDDVAGGVEINRGGTLIAVDQARLSGGNLRGWARLGSDTTVSGAFALGQADLGRLAASRNIRGFSGEGAAYVTLAGSESSPSLDWIAQGAGGYRQGSERYLGDFDGAGELTSRQLSITRSALRLAAGRLAATGTVGVQAGNLAVNVDAFGVDLSRLEPRLQGNATVQGKVVGTLTAPELLGHGELFAPGFDRLQFPFAVADLDATRKAVKLSAIQVASGQGSIQGWMSYGEGTSSISGALTGTALQAADFSDDHVVGVFDVSRFDVAGTVAHPRIDARWTADTLLAGPLKIDQAAGKVQLTDREVTLDESSAVVGGGNVALSGQYGLDSRTGHVALKATSVGLDAIPSEFLGGNSLQGTADLSADAELGPNDLRIGPVSGQASHLAFNGEPVGGATFEVLRKGNEMLGSGSVGDDQHHVDLRDASYDPESRRWSVDAVVSNFDLASIYPMARPSWSTMPPDEASRLSEVGGDLDATVSITGRGNDEPDGRVSNLSVRNLSYGGRPLGAISGEIDKSGSLLRTSGLEWTQGDGVARVSGDADLKGTLRLDGDISNFDLSDLSLFNDQLASLAGSADISFLATGKTASPDVQASLRCDRVKLGTPDSGAVDFGLLVDSFHLTPNPSPDEAGRGTLDATGEFEYQGLSGQLTAALPIVYPFAVAQDRSLSASISVPARPLSDFDHATAGLDPARTSGTLGGSLSVSGLATALQAHGSLDASAPTLALKGWRGSFQDAKASLTVDDQNLKFELAAKSSAGGEVSGSGTAQLATFGDLLKAIAAGETSQVLAGAVSGGLNAHDLAFDERSKDVSAAGKLNGSLVFGGSLAAPTISTPDQQPLTLSHGSFTVAGSPPPQQAQVAPVINPAFNVSFTVDPTRVKGGTAQVVVLGKGRLAGTLAQPDLSADFAVVNGTLRLPAAKLALQPGGTVHFSYDGESDTPTASALVNLEGHTYLTAVPYGDVPERYSITLDVTGDMLADTGTELVARSDPPDLSQDRILALLGEAQLLQGSPGQTAGDQVRVAVADLGLPAALDPITSRIADELRLDYLSIDYNQYDLATADFAKALGAQFVLTGRRQLGTPPPGIRPISDFQIGYHLPARGGALRQVSLGFGADQDNPWKLTASYGTRF